jgi:hypothetical protein
VAVSPGGRALVAWSDRRDGLWRTMAQFFYPDGSVGPLHTFGGGSAEKPAVGVDRNGVQVVAWAPGYDRVVARRIKPGYVSPLTDLTYAAGFHHTVATDLDGDSILVWTRHNAAAYQTELLGRRLSAAGTLGSPVRLGLGDRPEVALTTTATGWSSGMPPAAPKRRPRSRPAPSPRPGSSAPPGPSPPTAGSPVPTPAPPAASSSSGSARATRT